MEANKPPKALLFLMKNKPLIFKFKYQDPSKIISTLPLTYAGINSSIAANIAVYSPPTDIPYFLFLN